ncbi:hypothetical protein CEE37_05825 [candidate division LCP-89 bacterium B3_LCP]|uniref:VWFA domain-containing protein n=1 Tax=candidate division LCP-89 bacterium B3_LCP TaxID=2012998 RepID=A0A532V224_UNCL8|nr:MAG: hypothetical protein CEE37_05825 [candidate division LCP-89 bacterium B3_LCP]
MMSILHRSLILLTAGFLLLLTVDTIQAQIAFSPDGTFMKVYSPCAFDQGLFPDAVYQEVGNLIQEQDYNVTTVIYRDATSEDDDCGSCTLDNFINCGLGGFVYFYSHGSASSVAGIYLDTQQAVVDWEGGDPGDPNIEVGQSSAYSWAYYAVVFPDWFEQEWQDYLDQSRAITIISTCHGHPATTSKVVSSTNDGGVCFGYIDSPNVSTNQFNNSRLLTRMNGTSDNAERRTAGRAWDSGSGYQEGFNMFGNPHITLCPATEEYYPQDGMVVSSSGRGYFETDTYCTEDASAEEALTFQTVGNVTIDNVHWVGSGQVNRIEFDWDGNGYFEVTTTAHADKFKSWGAAVSNSHALDGDRVSPNGDDVEFEFFAGSVDVALVIDKSGSMGSGYSNYIVPAKIAASTFVGFMQVGDNLAVVSFNSGQTVNFPMTMITSPATIAAAQSAIAPISAGGSTAIGGAMTAGQGQLNIVDEGFPQAMVLLSDGYETAGPYVSQVIGSIRDNVDIYTIALGPDSDQGLLNSIAATTSGIYLYAPGGSDLLALYNIIRSAVVGQQTIVMDGGTIDQGENLFHSVLIDQLAFFVNFSMVFEGSDVDLELITPSGLTIDSAAASLDPDIDFTEGSTYDYYIVHSPEAGEWQLSVIGTDLPAPEHYTISVQGFSTLTMDAYLDKGEYDENQPILVGAEVTEEGQIITGSSVWVEVQVPTTLASNYILGYNPAHEVERDLNNPIGSKLPVPYYLASPDSLTLYDDGIHGDAEAGDGIYGNYFTNTENTGSYTFTVYASGVGNLGGQFTRESTFSTFVSASNRPAAPLPVTPINGAIGLPASPMLVWTSITDANSYSLQLSTEYDFSTTILDTTGLIDSTFAVVGLGNNAQYYWRVSSVNYYGTSDWSIVNSFQTITNLNDVVVYPNPYKPHSGLGHTGISFGHPTDATKRLTVPATVEIYTIAGEKVRTLKEPESDGDPNGIIEWDVTNDSGEDVVSGIYLYRISNPSDEEIIGKLAIIR